MMSPAVEFLRLRYLAGRLSDDRIDAAVVAGKLTEAEAHYIKTGETS